MELLLIISETIFIVDHLCRQDSVRGNFINQKSYGICGWKQLYDLKAAIVNTFLF